MKEDFSDSKFLKKLSMESEEIKILKWLESEKSGYDIGIERAILIWVKKHRIKWLKEQDFN